MMTVGIIVTIAIIALLGGVVIGILLGRRVGG